MNSIKILFENNEILIINKPTQLAVQKGKGINKSLIEILEKNHNKKIYPVHRLDIDTSGCLVIAKNKEAASKYSKLFFENKIEKIYYAITYGHFNSPNSIIYDDIKVKEKNKKAETYYKVIKKFAKYSLVEIKIKTGRMHQIRIHFNKINHPIIGDDKYGNFSLNREINKKFGIKNLMLYAKSININNKIKTKAPLPEHFKTFLDIYNVS